MVASALPLGTTSTGEIVDFELSEAMDALQFKDNLSAQLPEDIPIYRVEPVDLATPVATRLLDRAEYFLKVTLVDVPEEFETLWSSWVKKIMDGDSCLWEKKTKSGKVRVVNLRDRLFELELLERPYSPNTDFFDGFSDLGNTGHPFLLPKPSSHNLTEAKNPKIEALLRYIGSYCNDGTVLQPQHIVYMLEQVSGVKVELLQVHRSGLFLRE
jgi:uncharacterized protein (DUF2344 family)